MSGFEDFALDFADFHEEHGHVIDNALQFYVEQMRREAAAMESARKLTEGRPETEAEEAARDALLAHTEILKAAALKTERAQRAWDELTEDVKSE